MKKTEVTGATFGELIARIIMWFISTGFIFWGWSVLAPHLNAPLFTFWEMFAMRMGLSFLMNILWQKIPTEDK